MSRKKIFTLIALMNSMEANWLMDQGDYEGAIKKLQKCLKNQTDPESRLFILKDLGYCYLRLHWLKEAVAAFDQCIKDNPYDTDARVYRASAYAALKWIDEAIKELGIILALDPNDVLARHDRRDLAELACRHPAGNLPFLRAAGVVHADVEQEPVELRFGQRVRALLFQGVLRRQHEKGSGQQVGAATGADVPLLHGFEHRGLRLRRRPVDFVRQNQVGEDRTGQEAIGPLPGLRVFLDDLGTGDVAGHQVGCELDAFEGQMQRLGQRADQQGFCQPGHAFEQGVTSGEHRHQHLFDDLVLADDDFGQFRADALIALLTTLHGGEVVLLDVVLTHEECSPGC